MALDAATLSIIVFAGTGLAVFTILWLVFEFLRPRNPDIFLYRKKVAEARPDVTDCLGRPIRHPPPPGQGFFGWFPATMALTDDDLVDAVGLDGALFLSFERMMLRIFVIAGLFSAVLLFPTYATGNAAAPGTVDTLTMSNRPQEDQLLWIAFVVDVVIVYSTLYLLYREMRRYVRFRRLYRSEDNPANYTVVVYDIPAASWSDSAVVAQFEKAFPGEVVAAHCIYKDSVSRRKIRDRLAAIEKRERAEYNCVHNLGERPVHKVGCCAACRGVEPVDSIDYWRAEEERLSKELVSDQLELDPKVFVPSRNAFVTFRSKAAATLAVQSQVFQTPLQWRVERAGEPDAIHWGGVGNSGVMATVFKANSLFWLFFFLAFWGIVVALIMSVANLPALFDLIAKEIPSTQKFFDDLNYEGWPTFVRAIIEDVVPVVLLIVLNMIPKIIIKLMVTFERLPSLHRVEIKQRDYLFVFSLFTTVIYVLLSGTVLNQIDQIVDDPSFIVQSLSQSVPKQSTFFLNFILGLCFIGFGIQLSQIVRVAVRPILGLLWKTDRQKRKIDDFGSIFLYTTAYVPALVVALIGFMYSTVAPLVSLIAMLYFAVAYPVHKHNIAWTTVNPWQGGGEAFVGTLQCVLVALYLKTLTMIGIFALNKLPGPPIVEIINLILIAAFHIWLLRRYGRLGKEGALVDKLNETVYSKSHPAEHHHPLYLNKGLREVKEEPNMSGVTMEESIPTKSEGKMMEEGEAGSEGKGLVRGESTPGQFFEAEGAPEESGVPLHLKDEKK